MHLDQARVPTGIPGLDEILHGGLPPNHVYLVDGLPGTGKTTVGLQFLLEGVRRGEKVLYLTLLHEQRTIHEMAASHGWDISGVEICSMVEASRVESMAAEQTLLPSSEALLPDVMKAIKSALDRVKPQRVVFDSIEQFRLLIGDAVIYRQKILMMQKLLEASNTVAIFTDPSPSTAEFKTLAHGVITLDIMMRDYGDQQRRIHIDKMRSVAFDGGYHPFKIMTGGIVVYPRLSWAPQMVHAEWAIASSGIAELDALLDGGLAYGTSCLISGQAGTGKSSLATTYAYAEAKRGKHSAIFLFDERVETFLKRSKGMGMDMTPLIDQGLIKVARVDAWGISAGEFFSQLKEAVEKHHSKLVVIDSLTGYANAMTAEVQLIEQLHDTLTYLGQQGVLTLLLTTEHGIIGSHDAPFEASYIADSVMLIRRYEAIGSIHLAISVIKKRYGNHEKTIREMKITSNGIAVGQPIKEMQGVLTGEPVFVGDAKKVMDGRLAE